MINDRVNSGFQPKPLVSESKPVSSAAPLSGVAATAEALPPGAIPVSTAEAEATSTNRFQTERLQAAVEKLNDYTQSMRRTLAFSVEESTGRTVISVYDAETDELIRQIPPEEALNLAERIEEQTTSLLLTERA